MGGKNKHTAIAVEQHDEKEMQDALAGIKNIARESWFAALESRGLKKIGLSEIEFNMWWKERLAKAKWG